MRSSHERQRQSERTNIDEKYDERCDTTVMETTVPDFTNTLFLGGAGQHQFSNSVLLSPRFIDPPTECPISDLSWENLSDALYSPISNSPQSPRIPTTPVHNWTLLSTTCSPISSPPLTTPHACNQSCSAPLTPLFGQRKAGGSSVWITQRGAAGCIAVKKVQGQCVLCPGGY